MQGQKRDLSGYSNIKKLSAGIQPHYTNNINTLKYKYQIISSKSQKNFKISSTPNKKLDSNSRPDTGGSKSALRNYTPLTYKDKSRLKYFLI